MPTIMERQVAFSTPWFDVIGKRVESDPSLYYALEMADYVGVLAMDTAGELILVRQFRPAVETWTLEVPAGLLEQGESPEACARREVLEETGYEAGSSSVWERCSPMSPGCRITCGALSRPIFGPRHRREFPSLGLKSSACRRRTSSTP